ARRRLRQRPRSHRPHQATQRRRHVGAPGASCCPTRLPLDRRWFFIYSVSPGTGRHPRLRSDVVVRQRSLTAILLALVLAGCAGNSTHNLLNRVAIDAPASSIGSTHEIFVATTRQKAV